MVFLGAAIFSSGLVLTFALLLAFERDVHRERVVRRSRARTALRRLTVVTLAGGAGMLLLGVTAFFGGREAPPSAAAWAWAALFPATAGLGWPLIVLSAFMARVNTLRRIYPERDDLIRRAEKER